MTLLLGFAAVNTGNNLLYLIVSALLGFMAISGVLGKTNIDRLEARIEPPEEIYAGRDTLFTVHICNGKRLLPSFLLQVTVGGEGSLIPLVGRQQRCSASASLLFPRHGRHPLERVTIRSIFPVNFFVRSRTLPVKGEVVVFPAPLPCGGAGEQGQQRGAGREQERRGQEGEVTRIADYSGSEPMKLIHWKLSARGDDLKVRHLSDVAREPVMLHLEELPGATTEQQLRCASFLVNRYFRQQRPVGLRMGARVLEPATGRMHKLRLLTELALYDQD